MYLLLFFPSQWATAFMFQVPAVSIGMTMSYSVVGLSFYLPEDPPPDQQRQLNSSSGPQDAYYIPEPTMTIDEDQASWFGNF